MHMLFNMGDFGKENFVKETIKQVCEETGKNTLKVLEWEPPADARGILAGGKEEHQPAATGVQHAAGMEYCDNFDGELLQYVAVMTDEGELTGQRAKLFMEKVPSAVKAETICESWKTGSRLDVGDQDMDLVLLQPGAAPNLVGLGGQKALNAAIKESNRVLKPKGQIAIFRDEADSAQTTPEVVDQLFVRSQKVERNGVVCEVWTKKKAPAARARPGGTAASAAKSGKPRSRPGGSPRSAGRPRAR